MKVVIVGAGCDNTYSGCACDVPSQLYSLSFATRREFASRDAA